MRKKHHPAAHPGHGKHPPKVSRTLPTHNGKTGARKGMKGSKKPHYLGKI